jgi:hypothetical protein
MSFITGTQTELLAVRDARVRLGGHRCRDNGDVGQHGS